MAKKSSTKSIPERDGVMFINLAAISKSGSQVKAGAVLVRQTDVDANPALAALVAAIQSGKDIEWNIRPVLLNNSNSDSVEF